MTSHKIALLAGASLFLHPQAALARMAPAAADPADAPAAFGADAPADSGGVDEIIVTAQKRDENLQDVPVAITAVTADTLRANNITNLVGLSNFAPGLTISPAEGGDRVTISIRGVGQEANQNDVAAPSVSFHQDGVYIASPFALGASFLDLGSLEVLRGPQGTLFGQNSTGGATNINTAKPKLGETGGYLQGALGSYFHRNISSAANIPIGSTIAIRGSSERTVQDGSTKNIFNGQFLDDRNESSWRVMALWQPLADLSFVGTAQQFRSNVNGAARFGFLDPTTGRRRVSQDDPSRLSLTTELYSLVAKLDLAPFTVKYLGSYQIADIKRSRDNDFTIVNLVSPRVLRRSFEERQAQRHESYTSELNLVSNQRLFGAVDWVLGAFWFKQDIEAHTFERVDQNRNGVLDGFNPVPNPAVFGVPPGGADIGFQSDFFPSRRSYSVYGQATWHVSDALRVTGGLRYTRDKASNTNFNFFTIQLNRPTANITNISKATTGRLAVEYDFRPGLLGYVSFTKGFKPGGNNLTFGRPDVAVDLVVATFKPETIYAYEAGLKGDFLDRRLRLNLAGFYYDYRNLQAQGTDSRNTASGVVNVPKSRVIGLEAEMQLVPTDRLKFSGNLTVLDSKINGPFVALDNTDAAAAEFDLVVNRRVNQFADAVTLARDAVKRDINGNKLAKTPSFAANFTAEYTMPIDDVAEAKLAFTVSHRGKLQARIFNKPVIDDVPAYTIVNGTLGLKLGDNISVNFTVQNLFNTDAIASRFTDAFGVNATFDQKVPPRTGIASLRYDF